MSSAANRGKTAERLVAERLAKLSEQAHLAWYRLPDAHAGSLKATLADFLVLYRGVTFLVEVKEVQHDYRLPHRNFAVDKVSRMRRFKLAGARAYCLVLFRPSNVWRVAEIDYFNERVGGSWDMRGLQTQTLEAILSENPLNEVTQL